MLQYHQIFYTEEATFCIKRRGLILKLLDWVVLILAEQAEPWPTTQARFCSSFSAASKASQSHINSELALVQAAPKAVVICIFWATQGNMIPKEHFFWYWLSPALLCVSSNCVITKHTPAQPSFARKISAILWLSIWRRVWLSCVKQTLSVPFSGVVHTASLQGNALWINVITEKENLKVIW